MGKFIGTLELTPLDDGINWRLDDDFSYVTDAGEIVTAPKDTITDLASTPRVIWNVYPPFGRYIGAAVIHDTLYTVQKFPKAKCDAIFFEAMKAEGVSWFTRETLFEAVRLFGIAAWDRHAKALIRGESGAADA